MALVSQPEILPGAFAAEGDKFVIPANNDGLAGLASIAKGFPPITQQPLDQGGLPPQREDFNGIFNLFSQFLLYIQNGGVFAYNNGLDYQPPCLVADPDSNIIYQCLQQNGPNTSAGVQGLTQDAYWQAIVLPTDSVVSAVTESNGTVTVDKADGSSSTFTVASVPVGMFMDFAADSPPDGYLVRNGAAVSRTTYAALFAVIGTKYGVGDGETTFNLPNSIGKFSEGASTAGETKEPGLPNIAGRTFNIYAASDGSSGALTNSSIVPSAKYISVSGTGEQPQRYLDLDASKSNSIYGNSDTVQPPALTVLPCIKY